MEKLSRFRMWFKDIIFSEFRYLTVIINAYLDVFINETLKVPLLYLRSELDVSTPVTKFGISFHNYELLTNVEDIGNFPSFSNFWV